MIEKPTGQEGLEPSTSGFGDQRSTNWSYWPIRFSIETTLFNLCLAMQGVLAFKRTILAQLKLSLSISPILFGGIVLLLAFGALESNFLHGTFFLCFTHYMLLGECSPHTHPTKPEGDKKRALERI
jgi:hypothetical protein